MRRIAIVLFLCLVSCGTAKRVAKQEVKVDSTAVVREATSTTAKYIGSTRIEQGRITITEIEFFEPQPLPLPADHNRAAPELGPAETVEKPQQAASTKVELPSLGSVTGAVKSVKQVVVESAVEQKGESAEVVDSTENESMVTVERSESDVEKVKETTSKPFKWWRWLIFAGIGVLIVFIVLKRNLILVWLRAIIATIRTVF